MTPPPQVDSNRHAKPLSASFASSGSPPEPFVRKPSPLQRSGGDASPNRVLVPFRGRSASWSSLPRESPFAIDTAPAHPASHQGRMLLVSLLENFCMLYDQSPQRNRELFFTICKTLYSMGIIEEDYIDEVAAVRSSYMHAFRELVIQAMRCIDRQNTVGQGDLFANLSGVSNRSSETGSAAPSLGTPSSTADRVGGLVPFQPGTAGGILPTQRPMSGFQELLDYQNTRYRMDFIELKRLGRGGFGTVYKVKNRLDNREYAVKKVYLVNTKSPLEKILRECVSLAQLEHQNIVRYYSSWVEVGTQDRPSSPEEGETGAFGPVYSYDLKTDDATEPSCRSQAQPHPIPTVSSDDSLLGLAPSFSSEGLHDSLAAFGGAAIAAPDTEPQFDFDSGTDSSADESDVTDTLSDLQSWSSSDDDGIVFGGEVEDEDKPPAALPVRSAPRLSRRLSDPSRGSGSQESYSSSVPRFSRLSVTSAELPVEPPIMSSLTLHIQMQLCSTTLAEYLKVRNQRLLALDGAQPHCDPAAILDRVDLPRALSLFQGIVEGVAYLHSRYLIHRDIKPSNVFLDPVADPSVSPAAETATALPNDQLPGYDEGDFIPRLGDFGLVVTSDRDRTAATGVTGEGVGTGLVSPGAAPPNYTHFSPESQLLTSGVGTVTYAAPEQLDTTRPVPYGTKADMFSLGIILFELLHPFATGMERVKVLEDLRRGCLPEIFVARRPVEASLILWLMAANPLQRPSADEVLAFRLFDTPDAVEVRLKREIERHIGEKEALRQQVGDLRTHIARLEQKLAEAGRSP
ncbi:hypothetical protein IWQ60_005281 [Tieghemiomyces parasiticus]|uniref:Eukaryotic translation initiation factor 2-alpha kinase 1 n=1 Tax=Tieghemiomyces parasiticus TaxID=78921 RepID=A0A9W8AEC7_9FUNG|nr:hypothetical protein IWQ60_005281 [Tieghemiomyces parasiticus]